MIGIIFGLTLYMQFVQGYTALETGIRFVPFALGLFIGAGSADRADLRLGTTRITAFGFLVTAILMALASFWQVETAYWQLGLIMFGIGFSLGYIVAPATNAVMGALPEAQAGVGSAVNTVSRIVAGSIGVATIGSVLSTVYSSSFMKAAASINGLPAEATKAASDSVGVAVTIADKLPAGLGETFANIARESFMDGWQAMAFVVCGISVLSMILALKFMPPRHETIPEVTDDS
jgi:hypothetical protein